MEAALIEKSTVIMELTNENNELKSKIKTLEAALELERSKANKMWNYESKCRSFDAELERLERENKSLEEEKNQRKF